ncbi:hypothetical protein C8R34_10633 [Nitrosomonas sp. Nm84]|uniref:hypothetical protein n=1 Tax=Nitrosomonas sp. Nm84 TaxID=200124 RepID=UPI000D9F9906|nr:hypothetical protein [Nitrosomonas sp. Nm84]PXW88887.1 hypothetical protein C8R34_10633 [Nitrosomonas sp. Nm84]
MNRVSISEMLCVGLLAICLCCNVAFAQEVIKDSYIILFQENAGLIDPPNPANAGKVPMGQPTSGQSKEELAVTLGLNGEIVAILEANNGIVVRMNEQEAQKWRNDGRVQLVEQDLKIPAAFDTALEDQGNYPAYRDGTLTVPRVDTDEQVGIFQGGVFQYDASINAWRLQDYEIAPVVDIFLLEEDSVEVIVKEALPTQVFLKVKGSFSDPCQKIGRISHRLKGNRFEVVISTVSTTSPLALCAAVVTPFEKVISLPVYGLSAGNYEYIVNGKITGSFELKSDNNL